MWADNETDKDLLGFSIHAKLLASIVTNPEMLPVTVGLFGDWGGGKSSILKILQHDLGQDEDVAVIYFNSWVFEGYEDAKSAILTTLLTELRDHRNLKDVIGDEVKSLLKRVKWMTLLKTGASAAMAYFTSNPLPLLMSLNSKVSAETTEGEGDTGAKKTDGILSGNLLKDDQNKVHDVRSFRTDFQALINKTKLKAVVVLVDDLDRCSPERLIENLEAIKLFLNVDRTAFVVATDRRIVENAIRIRYSELFRGEKETSTGDSLVTDYLEKLIQVPYTLPKLAPHEVRSYLSMLFLKKHLTADTFEGILTKYTQFLAEERYAAFQLGDELSSIEDEKARSAVVESLRIVEACSDSITDCLKGNPRQIKRFLNSFWLRRELGRVANLKHLKDHIMIKLMVLEYISLERFEEVYQWHRAASDGAAAQFEILEASESPESIPEEHLKWRTQRLLKWLKSQPSLKGVDLRDYFWIARSSLADTLSGVRLMTQAMRACSENLLSKLQREKESGITLFEALDGDEQEGVIGIVMNKAMQEIREDDSLRSLLLLAGKGHLNAAHAFAQCADRIGADSLNPGLGITLRGFKGKEGERATAIIADVCEKLGKTTSKIGRALCKKEK